MKKLFSVIILLCTFFLIGCEEKVDKEQIVEEALNEIKIGTLTNDFKPLKEVEYKGYTITFEWSSNNSAVSADGKVTRGIEDIDCIITIKGTLDGITKEKTENVTVKAKEVNINNALDSLNIPNKIDSDITFNNTLNYDGVLINLAWTTTKVGTDERANIDNNGKVTLPIEDDTEFIIKVTGTYKDKTLEKSFNVIVKSLKTLCMEAASKLNVPKEINDDIKLVESIDGIEVQWYSSNEEVLTKKGKCSYVTEARTIKLEAGLAIDYEEDGEVETYYYDASYRVTVLPYSFERRVNLVKDNIDIEKKIYTRINLPTRLDYNLICRWKSNNKEVLDNNGNVSAPDVDTKVTLELTIIDELDNNNQTKINVEVLVCASLDNEEELDFFYHNIIDYTSKFSSSHLNNLKFNNDGKVVLDDNALTGTYESRIFHTRKFTSLVGSWSCITSPDATIELEISILINGVWSKYYTYGVWGLGKTNTYYNQTDSATNSKMSVDEIIVNSGEANACKYRVTLKRKDLQTSSPVLSLVCLTLDISESDYSYPVDVSNLPKSFDNEIPKLYQYDVPGIGGSICSATTTTMLLKWKGYSFTDKGKTYEHEYIASLVADPGHNSPTYGNWSYNMAVAGAYGDNAYVARMYSWDEVRYHLVNVGPMGASIRSSNGEWGYTTNGHLVIIRGYRISDSGSVTIICNDPAVKGVYYEVTLAQFLKCWRGVAYVMEK